MNKTFIDPHVLLRRFAQEHRFERVIRLWEQNRNLEWDRDEIEMLVVAAAVTDRCDVQCTIWDDLGRPMPEQFHYAIALFRSLREVGRHEEAGRIWLHAAAMLQKGGYQAETFFPNVNETYAFFVLGWLELDLDHPTEGASRWNEVLENVLKNHSEKESLLVDLLLNMRYEIGLLYRGSEETNGKSDRPGLDVLRHWVRVAYESFMARDPDEVEDLPLASLFLRELWTAGRIDEAARLGERMLRSRKRGLVGGGVLHDSPADVIHSIEWMDVFWNGVSVEQREIPVVPPALSSEAGDYEVLSALLTLWDGSNYRAIFDTFRDVVWEKISLFVRAAVSVAVAVEVDDDESATEESVRLASLFLDTVNAEHKWRPKALLAYERFARFIVDTRLKPKTCASVEELRYRGSALELDLYSGDLESIPDQPPTGITEALWQTLFDLHTNYDPALPELAEEVLRECPNLDWTPRFESVRFALADRLLHLRDDEVDDPRAARMAYVQAVVEMAANGRVFEAKDYHWYEQRFKRMLAVHSDELPRRDDPHITPERIHFYEERHELDRKSARHFAEQNGWEFFEEIPLDEDFLSLAVLRKKEEPTNLFVMLIHGLDQEELPMLNVRYGIHPGEAAEHFRDLRCADAIIECFKRVAYPELRRDEMRVPAHLPYTFLSLHHLWKPGSDFLCRGYDYTGYALRQNPDFRHSTDVYDLSKDGLVEEDKGKAFMRIVTNQIPVKTILEIVPLRADEIPFLERGVDFASFLQLFPGENFEPFAPRLRRSGSNPAYERMRGKLPLALPPRRVLHALRHCAQRKRNS